MRWMPIWLTIATLMLLKIPTQAAGGGPIPALRPLSAGNEIIPGETDRCPVCAMFPHRYPKSAAAMTLKSGETFYFCGNGCLLRTWLRPSSYLGCDQTKIDRIVVKDYFTGVSIDARKATWVAGSDVVEPMGPAIVALGNSAQLETFKNRHGGVIVFALDQLDDALWKKIGHRDLPPVP